MKTIFIHPATVLVAMITSMVLFEAPAAEAAGKVLVVFVHGFRGADSIERAQYQFQNENRDVKSAAFAEFLPYYNAFNGFLTSNSVPNTDFVAFKYNTFRYSNVGAGRFLNMVLKGQIPVDPNFPFNNTLPKGAKLGDYDRIYLITQSNGSLVVREAILQALGLKDDSTGPGHGSVNYPRVLARVPLPNKETKNTFLKIEKDDHLIRAYQKATVFDICPILGGPAAARSAAKPMARFAELNPFGKHNEWLFSEHNVEMYNNLLSDRHYTFCIVGDVHTGGIWKQLNGASEPRWPLVFGKVTSFFRLLNWRSENLKWLIHFERARGKDPEHHIEFFQQFEGKDTCGIADVATNNRLYQLAQEVAVQDAFKSDHLFQQNFELRIGMDGNGAVKPYAQNMSTNVDDYSISDFAAVYRNGSIYHTVMDGFFEREQTQHDAADGHFKIKPTTRMALNERHTILVFYKPLLDRIGAEMFGNGFQQWYASRERRPPANQPRNTIQLTAIDATAP